MVQVAVIIVTWNSAHLIEGVLSSLARQTLKPTRVLLVDNNSDDAGLLENIASKLSGYKLVLLPENRGFAAANNVGIQLCEDMDFVALLNPDAFPEPDWLSALVIAAQRYPEAAAFGSRLLDYADSTKLDGAGDYLTIAGKPGRRGHGLSAYKRFLHGEEIFSPCAAAALYRYSALLSVGGFDERFFCYVEDVDLAFRLLLIGYGSRYVPESVVHHIGSALTGRSSDFSIYYGQRNLVFNYVKNMPLTLFLVLLLPHLMLNLTYLLGASLIGRGHVVWNAKRDAIRAFPEIWKDRRTIQARRKVGALRVLRVLKIRLW